MSPKRARRSLYGVRSKRAEIVSTGLGSPRPGPLQHRADPFRIRENIQLFDPDADAFDTRIGKAGRADPLGKPLAQIDMPGPRDFADRGYDLFVIDDAAPIFSGKGLGGHQIDRDTDPLRMLALAAADPDAAHQHEAAHRDSVTGAFRRRRRTPAALPTLDHILLHARARPITAMWLAGAVCYPPATRRLGGRNGFLLLRDRCARRYRAARAAAPLYRRVRGGRSDRPRNRAAADCSRSDPRRYHRSGPVARIRARDRRPADRAVVERSKKAAGTLAERPRPTDMTLLTERAASGRARSCPGRAPERQSLPQDCGHLSTRWASGPAHRCRSDRYPNRSPAGDCRDREIRPLSGNLPGGVRQNRSRPRAGVNGRVPAPPRRGSRPRTRYG